jgi:mRNA interferase YafQ
MPSKKTAASKRLVLPRASDYTKDFLRDWQRLTHSGRYNLHRLKEAMILLVANDGPLAPEWLDYALKGDWIGHRECHVGGDCSTADKVLASLWCGYPRVPSSIPLN